jgi:chorismate dehydratase
LPFVFAAWVSNKKLDEGFIHHFNEANVFGLNKIEEIVHENPYEIYDLQNYYTHCINFKLDEDKKQALELFLKLNSPKNVIAE